MKLTPKLLKTAKIIKVGLAAASVGAYAAVFNWQFAIVIVSMLFVHESGHVWAMKRCGMRTKGIYFIPFFGGAAVSQDQFPSRKAEVFVALMGPIWGLGYAVVALGLFQLFQAPMFAAIASWTALITLINLLPINPLDGGRVTKSIAYSIGSRVGFVAMIGSMVLAIVILAVLHIWIFVIIILLNVLEVAFDEPARRRARKSRKRHEEMLRKARSESVIATLEEWVQEDRQEENGGLTPMTKHETAKSALWLLTVAAVCFIIMFVVAHIPGSDLALQVLMD
jgi:Zn-dependent protease